MKILMLFPVAALLNWIFLSEQQVPPETTKEEEMSTVDGPYVMYSNDSVIVQYIDSLPGMPKTVRTEIWPLSKRLEHVLTIRTDEPGKTFQVKLKRKLEPEKPTYKRPKKLLAISDIEGNFAALRKLLQGNGVIDDNLHWKYGDGHLVLIGDFVDRGAMVTEVLWLIYSLEGQAEAAGGKVHYILGNHEVMNMNGELNYVHPRYFEHASLMQLPYLSIFGPQAELGRWWGTKNVAEKIGNILFTHGGMSQYINIMELPLSDMNDSCRLYYNDTSYKYPSPYTQILFSDFGPFWYRGYYLGSPGNPKASQAQVDSTLKLYETSYITTGHTVVANQIVSLYEGKVINTDLQHAKGITEALLVQGNKMYRVDTSGNMMPLQALQ